MDTPQTVFFFPGLRHLLCCCSMVPMGYLWGSAPTPGASPFLLCPWCCRTVSLCLPTSPPFFFISLTPEQHFALPEICFEEAQPVLLWGLAVVGLLEHWPWPALVSSRSHPCCSPLATYTHCTIKQEQACLFSNVCGFIMCSYLMCSFLFFNKREKKFFWICLKMNIGV